MSAEKTTNPCNKFQANIFNKSKCQNCFKSREVHLLTDDGLEQVGYIYIYISISNIYLLNTTNTFTAVSKSVEAFNYYNCLKRTAKTIYIILVVDSSSSSSRKLVSPQAAIYLTDSSR